MVGPTGRRLRVTRLPEVDGGGHVFPRVKRVYKYSKAVRQNKQTTSSYLYNPETCIYPCNDIM